MARGTRDAFSITSGRGLRGGGSGGAQRQATSGLRPARIARACISAATAPQPARFA